MGWSPNQWILRFDDESGSSHATTEDKNGEKGCWVSGGGVHGFEEEVHFRNVTREANASNDDLAYFSSSFGSSLSW